jgi:serine/threonine protein phosphatase 1
MRLLAIGDIHGCFDALRGLESAVPILPTDMVITLGDYVNRGPQSAAVLEWLIARNATGQLIPLLGNHELMMLDARKGGGQLTDWLSVGGDATLRSYADAYRIKQLSDVPQRHWGFLLNDLQPYHETETHFFVHANAYPQYDLGVQPEYMLYWQHLDQPQPHQSGKIMICGHTSQKSGEIANYGHTICIDTWACGGKWLTCLDVATGEYWQANQQGEVRVRRLETDG